VKTSAEFFVALKPQASACHGGKIRAAKVQAIQKPGITFRGGSYARFGVIVV